MFKLNSISLSLQTINAQLYSDEKILVVQDAVGLYDGKEKSPAHTNGRLHLTTHRILYLDAASPHASSLSLPLSLVRQTEFWAGFLKSSAKITLLLGDAGEVVRGSTVEDEASAREFADERATPCTSGWVCRVCGMKNVRSAKCTLCGVSKDPAGSNTPSRSATPTLRRPSPPPLPLLPPTTTDKRIACPTCTFLNHPSMAACEVCDSPLSSTGPSTRSSTPAPPPPATGDAAPFVRLSFRKGGEKSFYAALKTALQEKKWEDETAVVARRKDGVGIGRSLLDMVTDAIMRGMDEEVRSREGELDDAFKDLNALMAKAKEMISLARTMNDRLSTQPTQLSSGETTVVRASLVDLGLPAEAVTPDMLRSEQEYHAELAKELHLLLRRPGGVLKDGLAGLDEVWCVWNRARGVALVSPKDLQLAAPFLSLSSPRFYLRTFIKSGLTVLHTSKYTRPNFLARLLDALDLRRALAESSFGVESAGITTLEVAQEEEVALNFAREMVEEMEMGGGEVVRDEQGGDGVRWYRNHIVEQGWEG